MEGYPKKAAEDWLDLFRTQARGANTTILTIALSLLVSWFAVIEPTFSDLKAAVRLREQQAIVTTNPQELIKNRVLAQVARQRRSALASLPPEQLPNAAALPAAGTEASRDADLITFYQHALPEEILAYQEAERNAIDVKDAIERLGESAPFQVFGTTIPIPKIFAVFTWSLLFMWLLGYIHFKRNILARFLVKSAGRFEQNLREETKADQQPRVSDIAGESPFWLAPVETLRGVGSERAAIERFSGIMGWTKEDRQLALILSCLLIAPFFVVQLRVAYIGFLSTDNYWAVSETFSLPRGWYGSIAFAVDVCLTVIIILIGYFLIRWLVPSAAGDGLFGRIRQKPRHLDFSRSPVA